MLFDLFRRPSQLPNSLIIQGEEEEGGINLLSIVSDLDGLQIFVIVFQNSGAFCAFLNGFNWNC